jgi:malate synthase
MRMLNHAAATSLESNVELRGRPDARYAPVLTTPALAFVAALEREFGPRIDECLARRRERLTSGTIPDFLPQTREVRESAWRVADVPADLSVRTVEITGPVDRKMIINALNSGADVYMADFEDANSPTWSNNVLGQVNLMDAVRRRVDFTDPSTGKQYRLGEKLATLLVRPRGLHLPERHVVVDGRPARGALVDFGLFFFHNAAELIARGTGPYFYLPKLESHLEARIWNDVFVAAQDAVGIPRGTIRATVLIETLPAAFEMEEILFELRDHISGLNCGRWDYIFSHIKTRQRDPAAIFPDRAQITMTQPCMRAYTRLAIETCHRRGAYAMGGMSAFIPTHDETTNATAFAQVRADKEREAADGHDGTWVAHPALVAVAREAFLAARTGPVPVREPVTQTATSPNELRAALLELPSGTRTENGLRVNARVAIQYIEAWLRGVGAVPLYDLMEDAATAEISRAQMWQWLHHQATLDDGRAVTASLVLRVIAEEMQRIGKEVGVERGRNGRFDEARDLFTKLILDERLADFLTLRAYDLLESSSAAA